MTDKEILEKAIQKAIDGGWKGFTYRDGWYTGPSPEWFLSAKYYDEIHQFTGNHDVDFELNEVIFNHDFAKALWGENPIHDVIARNYSREDKNYWLDDNYMPPNNWMFHLQQMVISPNPIQYLGDNL